MLLLYCSLIDVQPRGSEVDVAGEVTTEVNGEAKTGIGVGVGVVLLRSFLLERTGGGDGPADESYVQAGQCVDKVARTGWPVG